MFRAKLFVSLFFIATIFLPSFANISNFTQFYNEVLQWTAPSESYKMPVNNNEYFKNTEKTNETLDYGTFDFIIVGAGTAGGVMANRLTEENFRVLLVEAGSADPNTASVCGLAPYFLKSKYNWGYNTVPQKKSCLACIDQQCIYPRGKMLGGTSSMGGGMYVRGNPLDFDLWKELGNSGWSYQDVLPYFKKAEKAAFKSNTDIEYRGYSGPQVVDTVEDTPGLTEMLFQAFEELGDIPRDYNGVNQLGIGRVQININKNVRSNTAHAYIAPAKSRSNLFLTLDSLVTQVITQNDRAKGVQFVKNGQFYYASASKEVILSAGALNTPQILMLSGIGPKDQLEKHKIQVVRDLPVGRFLRDLVCYPGLIFRTNKMFYELTLEEQLKLWYDGKRPLASGWGLQLVTYHSLMNSSNDRPNFEIFVLGPPAISRHLGASLHFSEEYIAALFSNLNKYSDFLITIALLHPNSTGEVRLKSNNPKDFPIIDTNFFGEESDLEILYQGIQRLIKIKDTKAFRSFKAELLSYPMPGCDEIYESGSRDWWYCSIRHFALSDWQPVGTAKMGTSTKDSVVNPELKVHGIQGLRVVDCSIMPTHISGHTIGAVVMIAEKASDLIKAEYK
ncbi:unnamed protein product [Ceutorhynchus assimilis]|uniref:Glucose-methanol-choline oxidoreductase N-terminal domain-containing protein n=1 Tax=Ceutorhynchus assimilis TaxID=467358 RepID=A0A9N9Q8D6_9CUCU|nr:unnamed protein product [Ceutorhynchus assimilis]